MKEFVEKLIERLEERQKIDLVYANEKLQFFNDAAYERYVTFMKAIEIVKDLAEEHNNGWIPCEVIDHPEHCHDCEVTIKDVYGYTREIAYYTDKWRLLRDETPVMVVAWKEPSAPYKKGE